MRFGKLAILVTIAAAALQCSGNPPVSEPGQAALNAPSAVIIHAIDHAATPSGTQVILHANYPFTYTSYQPDARTLIVELPEVHVEGLADEIQLESPQVRDIIVSNEQSIDGSNIAKFEFQRVLAAHHTIHLEGNDLIVDFPTVGEVENAPELPLVAEGMDDGDFEESMFEAFEPYGEEPGPLATYTDEQADGATPMDLDEQMAEIMPPGMDDQMIDVASSSQDNQTTGVEPLDPNDPPAELTPIETGPSSAPGHAPQPAHQPEVLQITRGETPSGPLGHSLLSVETRGTGQETRVVINADGALIHEHFALQNPPRIVIDLEDVVVKSSRKSMPVSSPFLSRVRVAQFASRPLPVARIVLDLVALKDYSVIPTGKGLVVEFAGPAGDMVAGSDAAGQEQVVPSLAAEAPPLTPAEVFDPSVERAPEPAFVEEAPSRDEIAIRGPDEEMEQAVVEEVPVEGGAVEETSAGEASVEEVVVKDSSAVDAGPEPPAPLAARTPPVVNTPGQAEVRFRPASEGDPDGVIISRGRGRFGSRSISDTGPKYTGKRISLNFKDADLKDVFRLFHEITGYNIVLDPAVGGHLTIVLENVPEDQALDIILKNNGLDKVFDNNVIRIASTQKLASEAAARKALLEAQELEEEPITFTRNLSYAKAKDVTPIIKRIMSKRGDVIMDDRTNMLIITDLKDRRGPINRLIDALDEQTPQVVIEARIVETDREFERDFGIIWGVHGRASAATGTQTNLQFPHTGSIDYDVNLGAPASAGRLGISFGNVLDSFTLDATLDAFELSGNVKVLSSPRITTQNNQKAVIEQGIQIPVVSTTATQINVEFISASLKLEVTPQITKEGTVIMDIKVDNSSPDFINRVAEVPPIITERAETQILVADGGTAVIGGIFKLNNSVTRVSVPGLSKIPGLGWLFRNKSINRKNTELLIFITPRISKKARPQEDNT